MKLAKTRGQAIVEFTFVLPVFLMLIFAVLDAGRAVAFSNAMSEGARDGARYEITHGVDNTGTCNSSLVSQSQLNSAAFASAGPYVNGMTVSAASACVTDTYGVYYTIRVNGTFTPITTLAFGRSIGLSASSKMYISAP
ncbi:MAG: TadE/TadG family type IV pilus assembly protein [Chloroflexota bacterium]